MRYAMLLKPHPNVRYRQSLQKLALIELECILDACGVVHERPRVEYLADEPFLMFDAQELDEAAWRAVSGHSAICLAARLQEDGALQPMRRIPAGWMPDDLPQVLKYKGKTNADFTYLMLHCARAASDFACEPGPLRVLDPMCGKGTTLMCALCEGCDAVGVDMDAKALREAESYLDRSLKMHRIKHRRTAGALTLPSGGSAKWSEYALAPDAQAMRACPLTLRMIHGDAGRLEAWFGRKAAIWPYATCPMACSTPPERAARYPLCRGLWSGFCRDASARSSAAARRRLRSISIRCAGPRLSSICKRRGWRLCPVRRTTIFPIGSNRPWIVTW